MDALRKPTILVGVSGSPASAAALRWAAEEARRRNGRLRVVQIWHPEQRAYYACPANRPDQADPREQATRTLASTMLAVLGPRPRADTTVAVVEGTAERELVAESAGADLLVLGSRSALSIGPVVRTCLTDAHCPVVVVSQKTMASRAATPARQAAH